MYNIHESVKAAMDRWRQKQEVRATRKANRKAGIVEAPSPDRAAKKEERVTKRLTRKQTRQDKIASRKQAHQEKVANRVNSNVYNQGVGRRSYIRQVKATGGYSQNDYDFFRRAAAVKGMSLPDYYEKYVKPTKNG